MLEREGINFENTIQSDCADLSGLVKDIMKSDVEIHCMRDLTRGGLASSLIELATSAKYHFQLNETALPIQDDVKSACEILGFDSVYIANEGCFALFVAESDSDKVLALLHQHKLGKGAQLIGKVADVHVKGIVTIKTALGINRVLELFSGEQLPRIC